MIDLKLVKILPCGYKNKVRLSTDNIQLLDAIKSFYTVANPNSKYATGKYVSTTSSPITLTGMVGIGLIPDIMSKIYEFDPSVKIEITPEIKKLIKPFSLNDVPIITPKNKEYEYRDYQLNSVRLALEKGRGIFILPTSAGKSLIIYGIIENLLYYKQDIKSILILVPNIQLVKQFYKDLLDYGIEENKLQMFSGFSDKLNNNQIIIANRDWIEGHKDELPTIDLLIADEVHGLKKNNVVSDYVEGLKTPIKFGLTGTLTNKDDKINEWHIKGLIGPVLYEKKTTELQEQGYVANIDIIPIKINHTKKPVFKYNTQEEYQKAFHDEWKYIESLDTSNKIIGVIASKLNGNVLVLGDHIDHLKSIYDNMIYDKKYYIVGQVELDDREHIREVMENNSNIKTIANIKCFGTGINIKNIDYIVLVSTGDAVIKFIQAIGRGLRLNEFKDKLVLIDISHNFKYSEKHFLERCNLYKEFYNKYIDYKRVRTINI